MDRTRRRHEWEDDRQRYVERKTKEYNIGDRSEWKSKWITELEVRSV